MEEYKRNCETFWDYTPFFLWERVIECRYYVRVLFGLDNGEKPSETVMLNEKNNLWSIAVTLFSKSVILWSYIYVKKKSLKYFFSSFNIYMVCLVRSVKATIFNLQFTKHSNLTVMPRLDASQRSLPWHICIHICLMSAPTHEWDFCHLTLRESKCEYFPKCCRITLKDKLIWELVCLLPKLWLEYHQQ